MNKSTENAISGALLGFLLGVLTRALWFLITGL